jgi:hypothetical protein
MYATAQGTLEGGIQALYPLYEALPPSVRAMALAMASSFDPESVVATTRFLASGAEPFETASELEAIAAPTLVVPGVDPEHPAEVAALYGRHLPNVRAGDPTAPLLSVVEAFLDEHR